MNLLDLRYLTLFKAEIDYNGDGVDYHDYTLTIRNGVNDTSLSNGKGSVHEYNLGRTDIEELIEGLEEMARQLKQQMGQ